MDGELAVKNISCGGERKNEVYHIKGTFERLFEPAMKTNFKLEKN